MKVINVWLIAIASLFLLSSSCTKEESPSKDYSIENARELINQFNIDKFPHDKGEYLQGSVFLRSATNDMVVVFVNNESLGKTTLVYQIQTQGLKDQNFKTSIDNAQILFTRKNLVINAKDKDQSYFLALAPQEDVVEKKTYSEIIKGFGLARYIKETSSLVGSERTGFGDPGDPPPAEACTCVFITGAGECDSGGIGSTGCSGNYGPNGSFCSVSCDGGDTQYYACCNTE